MTALGEARKKLYDAFGDGAEDTESVVLAGMDAKPQPAQTESQPESQPESKAKTKPAKPAKPAKSAPAPQQPRAKTPTAQPTAHNREDMTRRLAARIAAEMPEGTVASYIPLARVVLAELREPTNGMLETAFAGQLDYSDNVEDWQRMIDAALEEPDFSS